MVVESWFPEPLQVHSWHQTPSASWATGAVAWCKILQDQYFRHTAALDHLEPPVSAHPERRPVLSCLKLERYCVHRLTSLACAPRRVQAKSFSTSMSCGACCTFSVKWSRFPAVPRARFNGFRCPVPDSQCWRSKHSRGFDLEDGAIVSADFPPDDTAVHRAQ